MVRLDSGIRMDSGARFDSGDSPSRRKHVAKINKALRSAPVPSKYAGTDQIEEACEGNPVAATLTTQLAALVAAGGELMDVNNRLRTAESKVSQLAEEQAGKEADWNDAFDDFVTEAQKATGGDPEKIRSLKLVPYEPGQGPAVGPLGAVQGLKATMSDFPGSVDLQWEPMKGAKLFIVQYTTTPEIDASWKDAGIATKSSFTAVGLASGTKYYFRVCAQGTAGKGPWSTIEDKLAP